MTDGPRIVLVGHDASRTGAPMLGLAWVRWLGRTTGARVQVELLRGGPLLPELAAAAPTSVWSRPRQLLRAGADAGLVPEAAWQAVLAPRRALQARGGGSARVVVANSVAAWAAAAEVRPRSRLVCWVHELDGVADRLLTPAHRDALLRQTDHLVAEGQRVADMVQHRWGVDPSRVSTVDSFVDDLPHPAAPTGPHQVVAIGSLVPRKGADLFVELVAHLHRGDPGLRAAWVGGQPVGPFGSLVGRDLAAAHLADAVDLPGPVADVEPWWPAHGVLVHPAREDPAPLVVLEAAQRGVPFVSWSGGGAGDLLERAGWGHLAAEPGDLLALARAVRALLDDPEARRAAATAIREAARHRTTEVQGPRLLDAVLGTRR